MYKTKQAKTRDRFGSGDEAEIISLEFDVLTKLGSATKRCFVFQSDRFWTQIKTAGSAIYANRHYLELYRTRKDERLTEKSKDYPNIIGEFFSIMIMCQFIGRYLSLARARYFVSGNSSATQ